MLTNIIVIYSKHNIIIIIIICVCFLQYAVENVYSWGTALSYVINWNLLKL